MKSQPTKPAPKKVADERMLNIEKTQGVVFVTADDDHQTTEFILEDVMVISYEGEAVRVHLREGHVVEFGCRMSDIALLLDAWRSRKAARRNA